MHLLPATTTMSASVVSIRASYVGEYGDQNFCFMETLNEVFEWNWVEQSWAELSVLFCFPPFLALNPNHYPWSISLWCPSLKSRTFCSMEVANFKRQLRKRQQTDHQDSVHGPWVHLLVVSQTACLKANTLLQENPITNGKVVGLVDLKQRQKNILVMIRTPKRFSYLRLAERCPKLIYTSGIIILGFWLCWLCQPLK